MNISTILALDLGKYKRVGVGNRKAGNAWLKWAFSESLCEKVSGTLEFKGS
jgi:hypothetical protein